jgi:hypothetical protein
MAEVAYEHDFSGVFAARARAGDVNGCDRRHVCFLPTDPLTDHHSMVSPEFRIPTVTTLAKGWAGDGYRSGRVPGHCTAFAEKIRSAPFGR